MQFNFAITSMIAYLAVFILLMNLGFWQLRRAEEKQQTIIQIQKQSEVTEVDILDLMSVDPDQFRYRKVLATGYFDNQHQYLLDNQVYQGKTGYFVLTPFILSGSDNSILVNRGWVEALQYRSQLPAVEFPAIAENHTIRGRINEFPSVGFKLEAAEIPTSGWPSVVQLVDSKVLSANSGYQFLPFQLEYNENSENGYVRNWKQVLPMPAEKHQAYAMQWFALSLTWVLLFFIVHKSKE